MIRGVIFDLDGTLVDSNELHVRAWEETFRHFGKEIPRERLREQIGKGGDQYLPVFLDECEMREFGEEADKYRGEVFKKKYLSEVKPFPKVRELFERLRADGKKIALASSGKDAEVHHYEKLLGIDGMVDCMTTADQVAHSKPKADVFIAALNLLSLPASEVVAVGDTPYDVQAGKKVDVPVIGVLCGGFPEQSLRDTGAVTIFRDPADLLERYYQSPLAG
ncbi:MAG TPA: HAD family phosphatase [Chthoniobacterales bacterium]|nr:HAD family phosphatase [Chthoniobacterales bacterium]